VLSSLTATSSSESVYIHTGSSPPVEYSSPHFLQSIISYFPLDADYLPTVLWAMGETIDDHLKRLVRKRDAIRSKFNIIEHPRDEYVKALYPGLLAVDPPQETWTSNIGDTNELISPEVLVESLRAAGGLEGGIRERFAVNIGGAALSQGEEGWSKVMLASQCRVRKHS
jgi:hypothetical protein